MRLLRSVLLALLFSLALGFAIGTALRLRAERPVTYIGWVDSRVGLLGAALPLDVGDADAPVLRPRHHEEQVREPVQEAESALG